MISIREKNYALIDNSVYVGFEIEQKGEAFRKNSRAIIEFFKNGEKVFENSDIVIPFLTEDNICVGKEIKTNKKFDDINIVIQEGETSLEEFDNKKIELIFDNEGSNKQKIVYKVNNHTKRNFEFLTLNIVFYNKGTLIGGTSVTLNNVLNERVYYFEYDVPKELEYTDHNIYLFVPPTNRLRFIGFYQKYNEYIQSINDLLVPLVLQSKERFVSPLKAIEQEIEYAKNKKEKIAMSKTKSIIRLIFNNIFTLLVAILKSIPVSFVLLIVLGIIYELLRGSVLANDVVADIVLLVPLILGTLIAIIYFFKDFYFDPEEEYYSRKEKKEVLVECDHALNELYEKAKEAKINEIELEKNYENRSKKIDEDNEKVMALNQKNKDEASELIKKFEDFKNEYSMYKALDNYDGIDFNIIDNAIADQIYSFEDIEEYRKGVREKMEEANRFERELTLLKEQNEIESQKVTALIDLKKQNEENTLKIKAQIRQSTEERIKNDNRNNMNNYYNIQSGLEKISRENKANSSKTYNELLEIRNQIDFYR